MIVQVFIQNEAGSHLKNYHDEKTLEWKRTVQVSRPYPYPYGFILGTTAQDGCNVDCFVITGRQLRTGDTVDCETIALMEQIEDGQEDHNVLVRLVGEDVRMSESIQSALSEFVSHVFDHIDGKQIHVGKFLGPRDADVHVRERIDKP